MAKPRFGRRKLNKREQKIYDETIESLKRVGLKPRSVLIREGRARAARKNAFGFKLPE